MVWIHCYGTAHPDSADQRTLVIVFPLGSGWKQELWFHQGLRFPHGLVIGVSAGMHDSEPLSAIPTGLELEIHYKTDAETAQEEADRVRWQRQPDDPHTISVAMPDFLRTGDLGPIHLGMTRMAVLDTLGQPNDWSTAVNRVGLPHIFKYGDIEFTFGSDGDTVTSLHAAPFAALSGGAALQFDPWMLRRGAPLPEVEAQLAACGIEYQHGSRPFDPPDTVFITTGGGIELGFTPQTNDPATLGFHVISWRRVAL